MSQIVICDGGEPQKIVDLCKELALGIEVQCLYSVEAFCNPNLVRNVQMAIVDIDLRVMHGPFCDLVPVSSDPEVRDLARKRFVQAWEVADQLQAQHLVFHHGYVPHTSWPSKWQKRCSRFWREFLDERPSGQIQIYLENHLELDPSLLSDVVSTVDRPGIDINLDVGHAHFASRIPVPEWIHTLKGQIGYVHLHDNCGDADDHLGFGQGNIPISDVCDALQECSSNAI